MLSTKRFTIVLFAICCGITASNVYLLQPIAIKVAQYFQVIPSHAGDLASYVQITYAVGIALLVPLSDAISLKKLLPPLALLSVLCLMLMGTTHVWNVFVIAAMALGFFCPIPQILIPVAAGALTDSKKSASLIGVLQAGLLVGILFSRFYSGLIADIFSVPVVFLISASLTMLSCLAVLLHIRTKTSYQSARHPESSLIPGVPLLQAIRQSWHKPYTALIICLSGLLIGIVFGAFWNTLSFFTYDWYHLSSWQIGLFGIVAGVSGATSPFAAKLSEQFGLITVQNIAVLFIMAGWAALFFAPHNILWTIFATIVVDVGVWSNQVLNQTALFALTDLKKGAANTLYFTSRFLGISFGSEIGLKFYTAHQWDCLILLALALSVLALALYDLIIRFLSQKTDSVSKSYPEMRGNLPKGSTNSMIN